MPPGPIHGLRFIHNAIRAQLDDLQAAVARIEDPMETGTLRGSVSILVKAVRVHAIGEDEGYFPTLASKVPHAVAPFSFDHVHELADLDALEEALASCTSMSDLRLLQSRIAVTAAKLESHMRKEEEFLWPLTEQHFTPPEQGAIMGAILEVIPKEDFPRLIPWMVEKQTADEAVAYVRMLEHVQPEPVFAMSKQWIHDGVSAERWGELVAEIPALA